MSLTSSYSIWSDWIISYFTHVVLSGRTWRTGWFDMRTFRVASWIWLFCCWPWPCWVVCWIWICCVWGWPCWTSWSPFCCAWVSIWNWGKGNFSDLITNLRKEDSRDLNQKTPVRLVWNRLTVWVWIFRCFLRIIWVFPRFPEKSSTFSEFLDNFSENS